MKHLIMLLLVPAIALCGRKYTSGAEMIGTTISMPKMGANAVENQSSTTFGGWGFGGNDRTGKGTVSYGMFGNGAQQNGFVVSGMTTTPPCYLRAWIFLGSAPPVRCQVLAISNNVDQNLELTWETNGKMSLTNVGVTRATTSAVVNQGTWQLVKMYTNWSQTADTDRIIINGETLQDVAHTHNATLPSAIFVGISGAESNPGTQVSVDDIAFNDASGSFENGAPDDSAYVMWLPAISDTSIGNWVAGGGSSSSLFDALNNVPVTGNSSETNTTNIKNTTSNASDNYDAAATSYQAAGVPSDKTVRLAQAVVRHGEHSATGTESGAVALVANPSDGGETSFTFGGDAGAHVTDATTSALLWRTTYGTPVYFPTIVRTNRPTVRVGRRTANTNQICVDMLGVLIEVGNGNGSSTRRRIIN